MHLLAFTISVTAKPQIIVIQNWNYPSWHVFQTETSAAVLYTLFPQLKETAGMVFLAFFHFRGDLLFSRFHHLYKRCFLGTVSSTKTSSLSCLTQSWHKSEFCIWWLTPLLTFRTSEHSLCFKNSMVNIWHKPTKNNLFQHVDI